jgi:hypothetical protein
MLTHTANIVSQMTGSRFVFIHNGICQIEKRFFIFAFSMNEKKKKLPRATKVKRDRSESKSMNELKLNQCLKKVKRPEAWRKDNGSISEEFLSIYEELLGVFEKYLC